MARVALQQASFNGGEISPRLAGRSDIAKYATSAEEIYNFIPRPEGGLMRRHGTRFVGEQRDQSVKGRIIPFIFSTIQAYGLVLNNSKIRFLKNRAILTDVSKSITAATNAATGVVTAAAHGFSNGDHVIITGVVGMTQINNREFTVAGVAANTFQLSGVATTAYGAYVSGGTVSRIYEIASPYADADVADIVYAQSADTMWLAHPGYAPQTVTRTADTSWTIAAVDFTQGPFGPLNTDDSIRMRIDGTSYRPGKTVTVYANSAIFQLGHVGGLLYLAEIYFDQISIGPWSSQASGTPPAIGDQVSYNGNVYSCVDTTGVDWGGDTPPTHLQGDAWDRNIQAAKKAKWRYLHSRYCILRISAFTSSTQVSATVITYAPDGLDQPAKAIGGAANNGAGLIRIATTLAHAYGDGDYVNISGVSGTTEANGDWRITYVDTTHFDLDGSAFVNAYSAAADFVTRYSTWQWAFGAFSATRGYPACVALHEQRLAWANTTAQPFGFWASRAGDYSYYVLGKTADNDPITYNIASSQVDPIRWLASSNDLQLGTLAQEFAAFGGGLGDPITPTNTRIVPQSGQGSENIQPARIGTETVFVNRAARKIFSLAFDAASNAYVSQDLTELADHFWLGHTITRIAWAKNPCSLLWALRDDGVLFSLTYRRDQQVFAWAKQEINGVVEDIAVIPSPDGTVDDLLMTVKRTINSATRRYVEYLAPPFEPTSATDKATMAFMDCALEYPTAASTSTISGLFNFEGQSLQVVGNGALMGAKTVTNGIITLDAPVTQAWVGYAYTSRLRPLRIEPSGAGLAARTKRASRLTVRVLNSLGGKVGVDASTATDELLPRDQADLTDASPPLRTGDFDFQIASDYDTGAQYTIVQSDPLPLDILCIVPHVTAEAG